MPTQKYLCMYRGAPSQNKPSPAQMQEMFAAFNAWKEKFKANILDMGSKLKPSGKVVTASSVTGHTEEARRYIARALASAPTDAERELLRRRLASLESL